MSDEFGGKKKKKSVSFADGSTATDIDDTPEPLPAEVDAVVAMENLELTEEGLGNADPTELFGAKKKKKKKKRPASAETQDDAAEPSTAEPLVESEEAWQQTDRDYTYHELLGRIFKLIRQNNPSLVGERGQFVMVPPQVNREGSKKTAFANIMDICKRMNRPSDHLISYLYTELATQGSVDGSHRLIIKGRFQQQQVESVLRRYIQEYVQCKTCKSYDSTMRKENRLMFVQCLACGSTRTVAAIKGGFMAQTTKRRLAKP